MIIPVHKHVVLSALLMLLLAGGSVWAQDTTDVVSDEEAEKARTEEIEATTNLRESIHENLDTLQEDAKSADDVKKAEAEDPPTGQQNEPDLEPGDPGDSTSELTFREKSFHDHWHSIPDYVQAIPVFLQSVPERVPFIRDRGLIFFGRTEIDYANYSSGITKNDSGFRIRSLRVGLAHALKHNISLKAEIDLTDGDSNFADLYVRYRHKKYGLFTAGNQRVAQTLVNQTSRISRTFMEEPLPAEAFGLGRRLALGWDLHKKKGGLHVTLFGPDLNGSIGDSGYASRLYLNPTRSRFSVFHVAASYVSENMSRKTRFFSHPESRVTDERLVDTGIFEDISEQRISALEVAGAKDSFMFRGEFFRAKWFRTTEDDPVFKGFYVQASWILTGETFKYTQGKFLRVRPQNPRGAWEAAVRFSRVDLNDQSITGGEEKNLTLAVNWYAPANQFRVMSNLIFVRTDEYAGDESPTIFQLRAQFHW
jgi:phosphate-selective porin OprO/OprP